MNQAVAELIPVRTFLGDVEVLRPFMSETQRRAVLAFHKGEEGAFFEEKMRELAKRVSEMPMTHQTSDTSDAMVMLHYFYGNCHWYIIEKDVLEGVEETFGFAVLNGDMQCAELGYISVRELVENRVELDFHFKPQPLSEVKAQLAKRFGGSQ